MNCCINKVSLGTFVTLQFREEVETIAADEDRA